MKNDWTADYQHLSEKELKTDCSLTRLWLYITLYYIKLHSLDRKLVTVTVGSGICHIDTKTYVQYNWSFHVRKPKKTQWLHMRLFKNTSTLCTILSTYAIYTAFKWMSHFLDNRYSSTEKNEYVFKYCFSAILNCVFSFIRLFRSDGKLLNIFIPA
jgi:hypothetical protein